MYVCAFGYLNAVGCASKNVFLQKLSHACVRALRAYNATVTYNFFRVYTHSLTKVTYIHHSIL